jgi:hypothetical protein
MTVAMVGIGVLPASAAVLAAPIHPLLLATPAEGKTSAVCSTRQVEQRFGPLPGPTTGVAKISVIEYQDRVSRLGKPLSKVVQSVMPG